MTIVLCHGKDGAYIYFAGDHDTASYYFYKCVHEPPTDDLESVELVNVTPGQFYPDGADVEHWLYVQKES